jgi:BirA family biotin operon repressor/biotin-[acetyl-CoA-carboxylase] ligase
MLTDALSIEVIHRYLAARTVGRRIYLYDEVASTNQVLHQMAKEGVQEGTVVLSECQTEGRGRFGKSWFSPSGVNLYASALFRPTIAPRQAPVFSFITSLALADAVREFGLEPAIKWPNDLLVERKKIAGVLAETATTGDLVEYVILGVGVNLNVERAALLAALGKAGYSASSLKELTGKEIDRNVFAARFLNALDEWFFTYRGKGEKALIRAWRDLDILTGRRVEVRERGVSVEGRVLGVDAEGCLRVKESWGKIHQVSGGEIRVVE